MLNRVKFFQSIFAGFFVSLLVVVFSTSLYCQENEVPHQWIVSWQDCSTARIGVPSGVSIATMALEPMKLSLIVSNPAIISDNNVEFWLRQNPCVALYQRNHYIESRIVPNDPIFASQSHHINPQAGDRDLDSDKAWDITTGGITILGDTAVVCVIDNGVNAMHPDLIGNMWKNFDEVPDNGIDDDGNGYTDDFEGWSVETKDDNVSNDATHGTSVVGIVAAEGNNNEGITGIMWQSKIMFVDYDVANEANAIRAYSYPYTMRKLYNESNGALGAYVVATNASWGRDKVFAKDAPLWCAMFDSLGSVGIINVAATSNTSVDVDSNGDLPTTCSSPFLISVTNLTSSDLSAGAGFGRKNIDIAAYGQNILTTSPFSYSSWTGTSLSAPLVTGTIGLLYTAPCDYIPLLSKENPALAALVTKNTVLKSAIPLPNLDMQSTTAGKLNTHRVVANAMSLCDNCNQVTNVTFAPSPEAIKVNWTSRGSLNFINIRYRPIDALTWIDINNVSQGDSIKGLKYCSEYEIQLQNTCGFTSSEYGFSTFVTSTACCNAIEMTKETVSGTEVIVSWPLDIDVSSTDLYYRKVGSNEYSLVSSDTNFYQFPLLETCAKYQYYIVQNCPLFDKESVESKIFTLTTDCGQCNDDYCLFDSKNAKFEWIESTVFGNISVNTHDNQDGNGYEDFIGITTTELELGKTYQLTSKFGYLDGISQEDYYRLYIDWNGDGRFDTSEEIAKLTNKVTDSVQILVNCPVDAKLGNTRMRQIITYDDFPGACEDAAFDYGEVEDFCIKIVDISTTVEKEKRPILFPTITNDIVYTSEGFRILSIRNVQGEIVFEAKDDIVVSMNTSNFTSGVYIVTIGDDQNRYWTLKFIKL